MKEIIVYNSLINKEGTLLDIVYENNSVNVYVDYKVKKDFFGIKNGIPLAITFRDKEDEKYILDMREKLLINNNGLKLNDIVGPNVLDAYITCVNKYAFKRTLSDKFGWKKMCLALNATKEGYGVQMLPYSNWTELKHDTGFWNNYIHGSGDTIEETWDYIFNQKLFNDKVRRLIFAKNKYGNYIFLGLYKCTKIDYKNKTRIYERILEQYS